MSYQYTQKLLPNVVQIKLKTQSLDLQKQMQKAVQMLNSSTGLLSQRLKVNINININGLSFNNNCCFSTNTKRFNLCLKSFGNYTLFCSSSSSHSNPQMSFSSSSSSSSSLQSTGISRRIKFCQLCGGQTKHEIPDGEEKIRAICTLCGRIAYENPKMVVGCLIEHDSKILLCKRNIQPSFGLWTLPAGYMEIGESAAEGAIRETIEEAGADVEVLSPFAHLDIPLIGQTYIIFLARMKMPHFSPGPESSECRLFSFDDIPFDSLAFSSMLVTLKLYIEDRKAGRSKFHYGTINKRPGTSPSDIHAYTLDDHLHSDKTY